MDLPGVVDMSSDDEDSDLTIAGYGVADMSSDDEDDVVEAPVGRNAPSSSNQMPKVMLVN